MYSTFSPKFYRKLFGRDSIPFQGNRAVQSAFLKNSFLILISFPHCIFIRKTYIKKQTVLKKRSRFQINGCFYPVFRYSCEYSLLYIQ